MLRVVRLRSLPVSEVRVGGQDVAAYCVYLLEFERLSTSTPLNLHDTCDSWFRNHLNQLHPNACPSRCEFILLLEAEPTHGLIRPGRKREPKHCPNAVRLGAA